MPPALGVQSLNHWTTWEVPILWIFNVSQTFWEGIRGTKRVKVPKGLRSLLVQWCSYLDAHYSHSQALNAFSESLSCVWLFVTPWTIQSMEFSGQNTGEDSLSLLQGIFLTQESNWGILHCREEFFTEWVSKESVHKGKKIWHQKMSFQFWRCPIFY